MAKMVPHWNWRTFGESFEEAEDKIHLYPLGNFKKSKEKHIFSRNSNDNTKIRDGLMDIKRLRRVNKDTSEQ